MLRRLFVQASHYFAGSLLVMIAGLISFPIITRLLSVSDYGLMALISSILVLLQSFAKAGLQHSTLRYYAEIKSGITQWNLRQYFSTVLIGMAGISGVVSLLWCAIVLLSPSNWFSSSQLRTLLLITAPLICLDVLISGMTSIMKAQERSITINVFTVIGRYVQLAITLTFLFFISRTVIGFFGAQLLGYSLALIVVLRLVYKGQGAGIRGYDWELQKGMLQFGIPLIGVEASTVLIRTTDNYAIQWFLGPEHLGAYAAAYNFTNYLSLLVISAFAQPVRPMYMRIFAEDGAEATRRFLKKALHSYCLLGFPIIAGSSAIGAELLVFIASEKYQAGGAVIPFTVAGLIIAGAVRIVSAGLYIQKKSMTSLWLLLTAALLNLILNIILIPIYGITGAALATMLSASIWVSITYFTAKQYFSFPVATKEILIIAINCLLMYLLVQSIQITGPLGMVAKVAVGVISYAALIVATDPVAKKAATELIAKIK